MNILHYLVQVNLYLVLFYGFYRLLLFGETFYALNRAYLVGSAVLSFGIPFWYSDYVQSFFITQQVNEVFYSVLSPAVFGVRASAENPFTWYDLLKIFYIICTVFLSIKLIFNLLQLKKLLENKSVHAKQGVGFSFFNFVFVDKDLQKREIVLEHEYVYIRQLHSADVMLFELIAVLCWFNPVVYFYKKSIKNIHEFIADDIASRLEESKADYAMLLFSQQFGLNPHQLTNNFFHHSTLKRRIEMLQKPRSRKIALLKYGFTAPLFALMLVIASASIARHETIKKAELCIDLVAKKPISELPIDPFKEINTLTDSLITGKVVSSVDGTPLSGVFIFNKRRDSFTATNKEGNYKIKATTDEELTFMNAGFELSTIPVTDKKVINVSLSVGQYVGTPIDNIVISDNNSAQEVVIVGYRKDGKTYNEEVFTTVDESPTFPGGIKEMYKFIGQNLRYPSAAQRANTQGKVFVKFIVRKDGSTSDMTILKGIGNGCDEETVRVIGMMPKWNAGKQNGVPVNVFFTMPVSFVLEGNDSKLKIIQRNDKGHISIRDKTSNNSSGVFNTENMLLVIDGKKSTNDDWLEKELDVIDVSVFKDAASIAAYGATGQNGVIVITTKRDTQAINAIPSKIPTSRSVEDEKITIKGQGKTSSYSINGPFNSDDALWVVDGVIATNNAMKQVEPDKIESISVLKNTNATALYGEKGKNGVIIVTTKKAFITKEEPKFTITGKQLYTLKVGKNREIIDAKTANEYPTERIMQVNIIKLNDIKARKTALNEFEQKVLKDGYDGWVDIWVREQ